MKIKKTMMTCLIAISMTGTALSGCHSKKDAGESNSSTQSISQTVQSLVSEQPKIDERDAQISAQLDQIHNVAAETPVDISGLNESEIRSCFYSQPISEELLLRLVEGEMYDDQNTFITPDQLRLVRMLYRGFDGQNKVGEMICNQAICTDVENVFFELFENAYPIERICLPFGYGMDDEAITSNNITRCLATVWDMEGQTHANEHSLGLAIDLNSLYNPQVITEEGQDLCLPEAGRPYADRTQNGEHFISQEDLAYQVFSKYGFYWGGVWQGRNDYQHFEKFFNHDTESFDTSVYFEE